MSASTPRRSSGSATAPGSNSSSTPKPAAALEWARRSQSPLYVRRAKRAARMLRDYVAFSRPKLAPDGRDAESRDRVKPPTKGELKSILHLFLDEWVVSDRRSNRGARDSAVSHGSGNSTVTTRGDDKAPTTSLPY